MTDTWGRIPPIIETLTRSLESKISVASALLGEMRYPNQPQDVEPTIARALQLTQEINEASRDLRAALSAYAHKIHQPRPRIATIAEAQAASSQGLTRRYSETAEQSLRDLISGTASSTQVQAAFPSLTPSEAAAITQRTIDL